MKSELRRRVRPLAALVGALLVLPCLSPDARAADSIAPAATAAAPAPTPKAPAPAPTPVVVPVPAGIPQPPGPAPEGKVWSPEHGHWHDIPGASSVTASPIQLTPTPGGAAVSMTPGQPPALVPQPEGPVPPGKVWSPEHGHWHDIPGTTSSTGPIQLTPMEGGAPVPMTPAQPAVPVPQPEGPVPAGKVWSPEHGHWHDAPTAPTPAPVTITPMPAPPAPAPAPPKKP